MKTIPVTDVKTDLDAVLNSSQRERIMISRGGKPCAVLVGVENFDVEDLQLATSPDFWRMIGGRRAVGKSIRLDQVESRLRARSGKSNGKRSSAKGRSPR